MGVSSVMNFWLRGMQWVFPGTLDGALGSGQSPRRDGRMLGKASRPVHDWGVPLFHALGRSCHSATVGPDSPVALASAVEVDPQPLPRGFVGHSLACKLQSVGRGGFPTA